MKFFEFLKFLKKLNSVLFTQDIQRLKLPSKPSEKYFKH